MHGYTCTVSLLRQHCASHSFRSTATDEEAPEKKVGKSSVPVLLFRSLVFDFSQLAVS
jgi:hypothetical protein